MTPLCPALASVNLSHDTASDGYRTELPNTLLNIAISSSPIWEAPSSPIDTPAWEPAHTMCAPAYCAIRIWSYARERKAEKVEKKELSPPPPPRSAPPAIFCSAMNISKKSIGYAFLKPSAYVELLTSASKTAMCGYFVRILVSALPYAFLVATLSSFLYATGAAARTGCCFHFRRDGFFSGAVSYVLTGPSSASAFSSSPFFRALPCQSGLFSRKEMPAPLKVFAIIITGLPFPRDAFWNADVISGSA